MNSTQAVLLITAVVLIVYDIWIALFKGIDSTISRVILDVSRKHPIVPFAAGGLCGHLFWPQN